MSEQIIAIDIPEGQDPAAVLACIKAVLPGTFGQSARMLEVLDSRPIKLCTDCKDGVPCKAFGYRCGAGGGDMRHFRSKPEVIKRECKCGMAAHLKGVDDTNTCQICGGHVVGLDRYYPDPRCTSLAAPEGDQHPMAVQMLEAAASTGHVGTQNALGDGQTCPRCGRRLEPEGTIRLAAPLAGASPCPGCGFVVQHCRCGKPAPSDPSKGVRCPFCGEDEFDAVGLKKHLSHRDCSVFNNTPALAKPEEGSQP